MNQQISLIFDRISQKIQWGETIQPILFLSENKEILSFQIHAFIDALLLKYDIDKNALFVLSDTQESLKIQEMRTFISHSYIKSHHLFQVFFIEQVSRMTLESFNSSLKFFEEPWVGNIIFLTNTSESWILDTILSRVQTIYLHSQLWERISEQYYLYIDDYLQKKNVQLLHYFFTEKNLTKQDYILFFETFLYYIKKNQEYYFLLSEIQNALHLIHKNNVLPKNEFDRLLLKI